MNDQRNLSRENCTIVNIKSYVSPDLLNCERTLRVNEITVAELIYILPAKDILFNVGALDCQARVQIKIEGAACPPSR
jgi:hypothetical protein